MHLLEFNLHFFSSSNQSILIFNGRNFQLQKYVVFEKIREIKIKYATPYQKASLLVFDAPTASFVFILDMCILNMQEYHTKFRLYKTCPLTQCNGEKPTFISRCFHEKTKNFSFF